MFTLVHACHSCELFLPMYAQTSGGSSGRFLKHTYWSVRQAGTTTLKMLAHCLSARSMISERLSDRLYAVSPNNGFCLLQIVFGGPFRKLPWLPHRPPLNRRSAISPFYHSLPSRSPFLPLPQPLPSFPPSTLLSICLHGAIFTQSDTN